MKYIDTNTALKIIEQRFGPITRPTLILWCIKYDLGLKLAGRWKVDRIKLNTFLSEAANVKDEQKAEETPIPTS